MSQAVTSSYTFTEKTHPQELREARERPRCPISSGNAAEFYAEFLQAEVAPATRKNQACNRLSHRFFRS